MSKVSIRELAASIGSGVHAVQIAEASHSNLVFMAIPFGAVEQFGKSLADWTGKTVVDTTNAHYTPTMTASEHESTPGYLCGLS